MSGDLAGKRAYVTGGSSGIGAEIVRTFAAKGARVATDASSRATQPREITVEAFLASDKASFIIGVVLPIDGGLTMV